MPTYRGGGRVRLDDGRKIKYCCSLVNDKEIAVVTRRIGGSISEDHKGNRHKKDKERGGDREARVGEGRRGGT